MLAAAIDGSVLSLGSLIGFLALFGLAARTTVLSIRHNQGLAAGANGASTAALVQRGAQERFTPIVATAAAVACFALPLAVLGARPGLEVVHPMALVILGGLVTSTLASLFVLPVLYLRFGAAPVLVADWERAVVTQWVPEPLDEEEQRPLSVGTEGNGAPAPDAVVPDAVVPPQESGR